MSIPERVMINQPGEGRSVGIVGDIYRFLATGEDTDGRYSMIEALIFPGGGPPPHIHSREEEAFYILDGEIVFQIGEDRRTCKAGTFIHMPIGVVHAFKNETDQTAKMLITLAPSGLEQYFLDVGQPVANGEIPPKPTHEEIGKLIEAAPRYGIEFKIP